MDRKGISARDQGFFVYIVAGAMVLLALVFISGKIVQTFTGEHKDQSSKLSTTYSEDAIIYNHYCWRLANQDMSQEALAGTLYFCDKALEIEPTFIEAWDSKGFLLARLERWTEAKDHFEKAIELKPDYKEAKAHLKIVEMCIEQGCDSNQILIYEKLYEQNITELSSIKEHWREFYLMYNISGRPIQR